MAAVLVGVPVLAGIVLGANQTRAGAFMPWALSIVYWTVIGLTTWWLLALATQAVRLLLRPWALPDWAIWLLGAVAGSFAARPAIYAITDLFRPAMREPMLRAMAPARLDLAFLSYYLTNWSVLIGMWLVACWWLRQGARAPAVQAAASPDTPPLPQAGLLSRVPTALGRDIVALQAEDHYVRVHTRLGSALVLGSLSDAIDDAGRSGLAGQRTHRSWWVASAGVESCVQRGRQVVLVLRNGLEAPVSVTYKQVAAASGLLAA